MKAIPQEVSESTRRRNPHLYGMRVDGKGKAHLYDYVNPPSKPLRQSSKRPNKTEAECAAYINALRPDDFIVQQDITFRLANGLRYTPDLVLWSSFAGLLDAIEVKAERRRDARWATDDSKAKIKIAAKMFPFIRWRLMWKESGQWKEQVVQP